MRRNWCGGGGVGGRVREMIQKDSGFTIESLDSLPQLWPQLL